ncbi:hypothetical protein [Lentzea sp. NEAU-D7]|uniref:hypothetical protein n=1 Tax=Lentzea sp. NEAU-D7 TaxID=2994667 RepID=UPI00224B068E|nr:hypothetical protein [Lentzea sp. NEAU-D7]MCX2954812.1 hypothetical protein [Lentzea sp. NEAU-D7]
MSSVTTANDDSDDMKIYQFDREASMDFSADFAWTSCRPGTFCESAEALAA